MGRRIRHFEPDGIYFVTNRCAGGRYLLTPGPELNARIEGALAHYSSIHDVDLLSWMFMGNHFHIIPRSERMNISDFMRDVQRRISREVQRLRENWNSPVFPTRYDAEPILDDAAVRQKIDYVLMNPVRAGLVRHPEDWPGVSSLELHAGSGSREVEYLDRRQLRRLQRKQDEPVDPDRATRVRQLEVTNPPSLEDRSASEAGDVIVEDLEALRRKWVGMQRIGSDGFAGPREVRNQEPLARPAEPPEGPEPLCHTTEPKRRDEYRNQISNVTNRYREALDRWRDGVSDVSFPPGTFPPGWVDCETYEPVPNARTGGFDSQGSAADPPRGDPEPTQERSA